MVVIMTAAPLNIQIVDDSGLTIKKITKMVEAMGHTVVQISRTGKDAIFDYENSMPDLVTMDITMNDWDGLTAAKAILQYDGSAKILFLSNLEEKKYIDQIEAMGAIGFVNKHKSKEILSLLDG